MTITASAASVWDGTYFARIQDALGNSGASVTLLDNSADATISGKPTGSGLKILAEEAAETSAGSIKKDTVTLSPAAQQALSKLQIALQVLSSDKDDLDTAKGRKTAASSPAVTNLSNTDNAAANSVSTPIGSVESTTSDLATSINADDVTALARDDPTQVIKDTVSAAQTALSDPNFFYNYVSANPQEFASLVSALDPATAPSFQAAFANKTLTIQNTANIYGNKATDQTVITGTSESLGGAPGSDGYSRPPIGTASTGVNFGVGSLKVSWSTVAQAPTVTTKN